MQLRFIRYDPRDLAEIRVFHQGRFLGRAICPDLAAATVSLKEITAARSARRRELRRQIGERASIVDRLIAVHAPPPSPPAALAPAGDQPASRPKLKRYRED
jgi:putative transposase